MPPRNSAKASISTELSGPNGSGGCPYR
jgi:hypothetical protein